MKASIIGLGSIGKRHAALLKDLGAEVFTVSKHLKEGISFPELEDMLAQVNPDVVWICNDTDQHHPTLLRLIEAKFANHVIIEKPLYDAPRETEAGGFASIHVSYMFRFHKFLKHVKAEIEGQEVLSAQLYAGQFLPSWRPGTDFTSSYSAHADRGGGVLRDLSHELDYAIWLFGRPQSFFSKIGKFSDLDINSDDHCSLIWEAERCPNVQIALNYCDRVAKRFLNVITNRHSFHIDFVAGTLAKDGEIIDKEFFIKDTYIEQAKQVSRLQFDALCPFEDAARLNRLIAQIKTHSGRGLAKAAA